jgi:adenylate cyclase
MGEFFVTEIIKDLDASSGRSAGWNMTTKVKRRLTSILCADVKSYARLMESNETRTIGTLRQYRAAMDSLIERHEGRIINTWGDAVIAEFASVVEAVQCAIEIQRELAGHNHALPEAEQMWFRIGINLGDVMVENGDLYGEGVNIAARLQELAEPGGILISGPVYDLVRNKLTVGFDYLGQQAVKNVTEPVTSYRIVLDGDVRPAASAPAREPPRAENWPRAAEPRSLPVRFWMRFRELPRLVRVVALVIVFLFALDMFDDGFATIWFQWPAAGLALFALLWLTIVGQKKRE